MPGDYNMIAQMPPSQGWQCPCCKTVYAPVVDRCCCQAVRSNVSVTQGAGVMTIDPSKSVLEPHWRNRVIPDEAWPPPPGVDEIVSGARS